MNEDKVLKSRLGTLLLHKGLISEDQLYKALSLQNSKHQKLGEILIENGWINPNELKKALKKQSRYRLIAALGAVLLTPIQPFMVNIATASPSIPQSVKLQPLNKESMREISAQGSTYMTDSMVEQSQQSNQNEFHSGNTDLGSVINMMLPGVDNILNAQVSIQGVEYLQTQQEDTNKDGRINVRLPTKIRHISLKNVEFNGEQGKQVGDIEISNITISSETTMRVHLKNN